MIPYSDLGYFLIVLALVLPMTVAGARGRAGPGWVVGSTAIMLLVQYASSFITAGEEGWAAHGELIALVLFGIYLHGVVRLTLRGWLPRRSGVLIPLGLLPLVAAKYLPLALPGLHLGFVGISYVTFRALDVLWCLSDGILAEVALLDFLVFLFFFPTVSSGPIDRFRRFQKEWRETRSPERFWRDLDIGVQMVFLGLLYKFVLAGYIDKHLVHHTRKIPGIWGAIQYAYSYSAFLFFDFAGYSAFAIGVSHWFGVRSPQNFNRPFAARNIRDFWNRWHMSLSFWFRDHVYTRFVIAAMKGKWFRQKETAGRLGYFVSFGLMGAWHGLTWHYLLYGVYHAVLFNIHDAFGRWKKRHPGRCTGRPWVVAAHFLTVHCVIFGFWLFSGHGVLTAETAKAGEAGANRPIPKWMK